MMTRSRAIKAKMTLYGYTIKSLGLEIGTGEQNLAKKLRGERQFRQLELSRIKFALKLTDEEFISYFFEDESDDVKTDALEYRKAAFQ